MPQHCDVLSGDVRCGSSTAIMVLRTRTGGNVAVCYGHQRELRRGSPLTTRRGTVELPKVGRVAARIKRGG
jgi:hypothetical protein